MKYNSKIFIKLAGESIKNYCPLQREKHEQAI